MDGAVLRDSAEEKEDKDLRSKAFNTDFQEKYHQKEKTVVDTNMYLAVIRTVALQCQW